MRTKDFSFNLPDNLIAQKPSEKRGDDRLLVLNKNTGEYRDLMMSDFPSLIDSDTVMVINNSKVRKARVFGESETGRKAQFLFLNPEGQTMWRTMTTGVRKLKIGSTFSFDGIIGMVSEIHADRTVSLVFDSRISEDFFENHGHVPLPPYIRREDAKEDAERYQTVYAKIMGSVACPTAGLHFTRDLLDEIGKKVKIYEVTLHVGAGTFLPVRTENIEDHIMHKEVYSISKDTADSLNEAKRNGKKILSVGTTSMRTLESASDEEGIIKSGESVSDIFIYPGYRFKFTDSLLTNFHTPESTLLMLVSALAGRENILRAYEHAVDESYRFFSYGDAMLIL